MKNVHICYIGVTEGKIENLKKEGKMRISILILIYTMHFDFAYLSFFLLVLARSNFDHYARECNFGILKKKQKQKKKTKKKQKNKKIFRLCF